jgi:hypothetical protein
VCECRPARGDEKRKISELSEKKCVRHRMRGDAVSEKRREYE